jgi:recombination protein RecT
MSKDISTILSKESSVEAVRSMLPSCYKDFADRFIQRAKLTFAVSKSRAKLAQCDPRSVVQAICVAAEYGFALDDKFVYAIPYLNKQKDPVTGRDTQVMECQATFDYKALVAVARRHGLVLDLRAQEVCEKDDFDYCDEDFTQRYRFRKAIGERGAIVGAYAVVSFPNGGHRFEHMAIDELKKVRAASKSPDSPAWLNWENRMFCKAVAKRALTYVQDNPTLGELINYDNLDYDMDKVVEAVSSRSLEDLTREIHESVSNTQKLNVIGEMGGVPPAVPSPEELAEIYAMESGNTVN